MTEILAAPATSAKVASSVSAIHGSGLVALAAAGGPRRRGRDPASGAAVTAPDNPACHGSVIPSLRSAVTDRAPARPASLSVRNTRQVNAPEPPVGALRAWFDRGRVRVQIWQSGGMDGPVDLDQVAALIAGPALAWREAGLTIGPVLWKDAGAAVPATSR